MHPISRRRFDILLVMALVGFLASGCAVDDRKVIRSNRVLKSDFIEFGRSTAYDSPPKLVEGSSPIYPITLDIGSVAGSATVEFVVSEDGITRDVKIIEATHEPFGRHTAIAIRQWRFQPAQKNGHPVAVPASITWTFVRE